MRALRNIIISFLILNVLGSTLMVPLVYLDFELRREYIARVLCIKKDEPITVCGGKCYLAKQLNKASEQQQNDKQNTSRTEPISFFKVEIVEKDYSRQIVEINAAQIPKQDTHVLRSFVADIFHPPQKV
ncbi:hypothetical protein LVD17_02820 [Fulvivirga ulvae]|uniref:hypothetical protein n=1 Tax=Fulvivirga ulvae TaxID=2904245 RepID=UPI001F25E33A|nr:hypothetical protein [Fulvivirga ulvae]UII32764.1 hypothetical protein LVD17_02820 [Fulvivirga ulvae]